MCAPTTARTASPSTSAIDRGRRCPCCTCPTSPRCAPSAGWPPSSTGRRLEDVLTDEDGVVAWLWTRWRSLDRGRARRGRARAHRAGLPTRDLALAGRRADVGAVLLRVSSAASPDDRRTATRRGVSAPEPAASAIALSGVTVRREGVPVLDGGRLAGGHRPTAGSILGPNGSGKTTLLQVAAARLWPTAGTVEILGARLGRVDVRTLRPRVALVSGAVTRQLRADLPARDVVVERPPRRARDLVEPVHGRGLGQGGPAAGRRRRGRDRRTGPSG